ncbi:MAG: hypothetical protein WC612_03400 [Bdellovibrionales bacterium]
MSPIKQSFQALVREAFLDSAGKSASARLLEGGKQKYSWSSNSGSIRTLRLNIEGTVYIQPVKESKHAKKNPTIKIYDYACLNETSPAMIDEQKDQFVFYQPKDAVTVIHAPSNLQGLHLTISGDGKVYSPHIRAPLTTLTMSDKAETYVLAHQLYATLSGAAYAGALFDNTYDRAPHGTRLVMIGKDKADISVYRKGMEKVDEAVALLEGAATLTTATPFTHCVIHAQEETGSLSLQERLILWGRQPKRGYEHHLLPLGSDHYTARKTALMKIIQAHVTDSAMPVPSCS